MQRRFFITIVLVLIIGGFFIFPKNADAAERWDIQTTLQEDGSTLVQLGIEADEAIDGWTFMDPKIDMDTLIISDPEGNNISYTVQKKQPRIYIKFDPAEKIKFTYIVPNTVRDFSVHYEWVFEIVGEPVDREVVVTRASFRFPENDGAVTAPHIFVVSPSEETPVTQFAEQLSSSQFSASEITIPAYHRMTVVSRIPMGIVTLPKDGFLVKYGYILLGLFLLSPLGLLIVLMNRWYHLGRDPKVEADVDMSTVSAGMMGVIKDEFVGHKDICADIIELAQLGAIRMERKKGAWVLTKRSPKKKILPTQKALVSQLFGRKKVVPLASEVALKPYVNALYAQVTEQGYFTSNPAQIRRLYFAFGALLVLFGYVGILFIYGFPIFLLGFILLVFAVFMPQKTEKGVTIYHAAKRYRALLQDASNWDELPAAIVFSEEPELIARTSIKPPAYFFRITRKQDVVECLQQLHVFCARGIHID